MRAPNDIALLASICEDSPAGALRISVRPEPAPPHERWCVDVDAGPCAFGATLSDALRALREQVGSDSRRGQT